MVVSTDTGGYETASLPGAEIQASVDCMSKGKKHIIVLYITVYSLVYLFPEYHLNPGHTSKCGVL